MREKLKKIRSGGVQRALSFAKVSVSGAAKAGWQQVAQNFREGAEKEGAWQQYLLSQAKLLTDEVSRLKGSAMKAGQMLSLYGERLLPPEVNEVLRTLQSQSLALEWAVIEKVLRKELGDEKLAQLEIDPEPIGAASLGQVHAATVRSTGERIALKVKYPGIEGAIESDLKWLRTLLKMSRLVSFGPALDRVFDEARRMLIQEVDYRREFVLTQSFHELFKNDSRYVVPQPRAEFSANDVLATTFEAGTPLEDPSLAELSPERRNRLGSAFLELYLKEVFEFRKVQSDSHFGNFRVRLDPAGEDDQWVLYDFGAVRELGEEFVRRYHALGKAAYENDAKATAAALVSLGMLLPDGPADYAETLVSLCELGTEPVRHPGEYDWGKSDLPERVAAYIPKLAFRRDVRLPPEEMISMDRKAAGVFMMLAKLKVKIDSRALVSRYLS